MTLRLAPLLLLPMLLTACATGAPKVVSSGPAPAGDGAYRIATVTPEAVPLEPLVEARLRTAGFRPAETGAHGYLVELSFGERPIHVGAFEQEAAPEKRDDPAWRRAPSPKRWWKDPDLRACVLTVRISEAKTGQEVYRADASTRRRKARCAESAPRLVEAALPAAAL